MYTILHNILTPPVVLATVLAATVAVAAPPANSPGTYRSWFESLRQPKTGAGCCSIADCRLTEYRLGPGGYEVAVEDRWVRVPEDRILRGITNPTGRAVACIWGGEVRCFITPPET